MVPFENLTLPSRKVTHLSSKTDTAALVYVCRTFFVKYSFLNHLVSGKTYMFWAMSVFVLHELLLEPQYHVFFIVPKTGVEPARP